MKKLLLVLLLLFSLVACSNNNNDKVEVEENTYESPYVKHYNFSTPILNEVYYNYHEVFAGIYLDIGYNINITEDAPQTLIDKLEQSGVKYHIVKFSYSELWTVHELILDTIINENMDNFRGIGVSEMDNTIQLSLKTDTVIPEYLFHYIEIGILTIDYTDLIATFN